MKNRDCIHTIIPPTVPTSVRLPPWFGSMLRVVAGWIERSRQRRQLAMLNDAALKDIGLTHAHVRTEIEKPFWTL